MTLKVDEVALVREHLFECGVIAGGRTMVDVGAHKGSSFAPFVRAGWDVWAFEPNTVLYEALVSRFGMWRNLRLFPVAVSDVEAQAVAFFTSEQSTGISSLLDFHESHEFSESVATRRIDAIGPDEIDFLKIDTEGFDRQVFRSCGAIRPRVLVTEYEDNKTRLLGYGSKDYADELVEAGYRVWASVWDPIVRYGGDHNWRELSRYDGHAPDERTWGNLIAVHESTGVDSDVIDEQLRRGVPSHAAT